MKQLSFRIPKFFSVVVVGVALVAGCAKYTPRPLQQPIGIANEHNGVAVTVANLTDADCFYHFSRRAARKGYRPMQLCIKNNSRQSYVLDAANIGLQIENRRNVAHRLHLNTAGRVLGWGIPGLFMWPFLVTACVEGVWSSEANKKLDNDFNERVISNSSRIVITPYATINKVLFVKIENFKSSFDLVLKNQHSNESLSFTVGDSFSK